MGNCDICNDGFGNIKVTASKYATPNAKRRTVYFKRNICGKCSNEHHGRSLKLYDEMKEEKLRLKSNPISKCIKYEYIDQSNPETACSEEIGSLG